MNNSIEFLQALCFVLAYIVFVGILIITGIPPKKKK